MVGTANAAVIAATIVVMIIVIIITLIAVIKVEQSHKKSEAMSTVYGMSFMNLPHAPFHQATSLERADVGAGPGFQFHPERVAGGSFSDLV